MMKTYHRIIYTLFLIGVPVATACATRSMLKGDHVMAAAFLVLAAVCLRRLVKPAPKART